jgi:acyl-coenzyme A thioesterase PaaI-like protein
MPSFLEIYNKLTNLPFGRYLFDKDVGFVAPFFGKIHPHVIELKPSLCVVKMRDRRGVRNHIGTVNAGAMCTLAELTAGMAVDATIPKHLRWIPKKMTVAYLAKGKGTLEAVCSFDERLLQEGDVILPVSIKNTANREVCAAEITFHINRKKP